ncbi:MAG: diacylglycerol kinase [Proteobacteria bacterium]|nr:diacylglycerol kinase [Pseudomonadota bacterium]
MTQARTSRARSSESAAAAPAVSPFKGKTGLRRIVQAFCNSLAGLADAWRGESAFRQEIILTVALVPVACLAHVSRIERAALIGSTLLVLIVELLNSSVEAAIDRISLDRHSLSRRAKDLGSAAVFIALLLLGCVWALVFWPR